MPISLPVVGKVYTYLGQPIPGIYSIEQGTFSELRSCTTLNGLKGNAMRSYL